MFRKISTPQSVVRQIKHFQCKAVYSSQSFRFLQFHELPEATGIVFANFSTGPKLRSDTHIKKENMSSMAGTQYNVDHDTKNNFFFILLEGKTPSDPDGSKAMIEYDWISPTLVDMHHTETPPQFQGKGIAKHLAKAAFDYFSEKGITMRPTCTYLQKYLRENPLPKYMDHIDKAFKT